MVRIARNGPIGKEGREEVTIKTDRRDKREDTVVIREAEEDMAEVEVDLDDGLEMIMNLMGKLLNGPRESLPELVRIRMLEVVMGKCSVDKNPKNQPTQITW